MISKSHALYLRISNYILAEGLYRSRLDPFAELSEISIEQRQMLFKELREVASTSYQAQGLTRPDGGTYRGLDGSRGEFEFQLQVRFFYKDSMVIYV